MLNAMNADRLLAYSAACGFFARVLCPGLDVDLLRHCAQERVFDAWPLPPLGSEAPAALAMLGGVFADLSEDSLALIEQDNTVLLIGPENPVPMWESVWTTEERLLFADCTEAVQQDFARFGFAIPHADHQPSDHLAFELSFLAALLARAGQALDAGEHGEAGRHVTAAAAFISEHTSKWAAECLAEIEGRAGTDFYRGVSRLCAATLAALPADLATDGQPG